MKHAALIALLLATTAQAETLHQKLFTLDTHLDTPSFFDAPGWDFAARHDPAIDLSQVDLQRMQAGNLDGGFFVIYTGQGPLTPEGYAAALAHARNRSDSIDRVMAANSRAIGLATTADEALALHKAGKLVAFKSMENSYPLGEDLSLLAEFKRRGVRLAGPVHGANNQLADSSGDKPKWNGLSPLGRKWVAEMNRLGLVIDPSHSSDDTFDQLLELSKTPLLLSHSGSRDFTDLPRNLSDDRIRKLAAKGGAICVTSVFLAPMNMTAERAALFEKFENIETLSQADREEMARQWRALDQRDPIWKADFERFVQATLHVLKVAGPDHVCFGADWDGGGGIAGLADITALPHVTERLKAAGYSEADLEKMWSGNILRILRAAEVK
ncbi:dipeptidase [Sandaracinobacteroides hominis]|uniref:dipeptidase n=1 Tax=Sandaracinobacteroides hominis TaxID=2780086 RepID=UPI0018F5B9CE|nr:dipeptidase [Sandaracinobacteroides hominis]